VVLNELALFAGAGGGILGGFLLGWRTICAVEINPYCRSRLLDRQREGHLQRFPIWDDIRTFDGHFWRDSVDVVSGGFPCQDISSAGTRKGLAGARSKLWFEMLRVIGEVRPTFVIAENSPHLRTNGLGTIIKGLSGMGYVGGVGVLGAWHVGANHRRNRMWIVAYSNDSGKRILPEQMEKEEPQKHNGSEIGRIDIADTTCGRCQRQWGEGDWRWSKEKLSCESMERSVTDSHSQSLRQQSGRSSGKNRQEAPVARSIDWWSVDSFSGVDDGVANRMERVRATGEGQVPAVAVLAWKILTEGLRKEI